jgi:hypothetical protein
MGTLFGDLGTFSSFPAKLSTLSHFLIFIVIGRNAQSLTCLSTTSHFIIAPSVSIASSSSSTDSSTKPERLAKRLVIRSLACLKTPTSQPTQSSLHAITQAHDRSRALSFLALTRSLPFIGHHLLPSSIPQLGDNLSKSQRRSKCLTSLLFVMKRVCECSEGAKKSTRVEVMFDPHTLKVAHTLLPIFSPLSDSYHAIIPPVTIRFQTVLNTRVPTQPRESTSLNQFPYWTLLYAHQATANRTQENALHAISGQMPR